MKAIRLLSVGLLAALAVSASDISGKWISKAGDRGVDTVTMTLKADHDKLTGTVSGPPTGEEVDISEGEIKGSRVSFTVPRDRTGTQFDWHYEGSIEGGTIHFTVEFGDTNFRARRKFDVKRAAGS